MKDYNKKVNILGIVSMSLVLFCLFLPPVCLWIGYDITPGWSGILAIATVIVPAFIFNWIVQPSSYYSAMGAAGTYMGWSAGSVADIRMPAVAMAQETTKVEAGTPESDAISAMAVACTVFVSVGLLTLFTIIGDRVMAILPEYILASFDYVVVSIFAAVVANMAVQKLDRNLVILVVAFALYILLPKIGLNTAFLPLITLIAGILISYAWFKADQKKAAQAAQKKD